MLSNHRDNFLKNRLKIIAFYLTVVCCCCFKLLFFSVITFLVIYKQYQGKQRSNTLVERKQEISNILFRDEVTCMLSLPHYFFIAMDTSYIANFLTLQITDIGNAERPQILMTMGLKLGLGIICT